MITLKNVSKWYGHFQVLTDCSTEVKKGEVVVVCGPSGSGKSTLIKTVNGLEPVQQGEITVDGIVVNDKKTDLAKLRSRVGMVFQHFELFPHLSIIENLTLAQVKVLKRNKAPAREKAACGDRSRIVHGSYCHAVRRTNVGAGSGDDQRSAGRDGRTGERRNDDDGGDPRNGLCP